MVVWKILSPKQVKSKPYSFTCKYCNWRGNVNRKLDYTVTKLAFGGTRIDYNEPIKDYRIEKFPARCRSCDTKKKRYTRMVNRIDNIFEESFSYFTRTYKMPKLITFALPSTESESYEERECQIDILKSKLKDMREILMKNGVQGGTYIIECTSRFLPFPDYPLFTWKHHAHIHMVGIAPYVPKKHFKEFCEQLLPIGLGRINYVVPRGENAREQVASYISKYLIKDGNNSRTFGIMRNQEK